MLERERPPGLVRPQVRESTPELERASAAVRMQRLELQLEQQPELQLEPVQMLELVRQPEVRQAQVLPLEVPYQKMARTQLPAA